MLTPKETAEHMLRTYGRKDAVEVASCYVMNNHGRNPLAADYWQAVLAELKKLGD